MGRIPDEDVARVRDSTDVAAYIAESVVLKKKGRLLWGLCPFHNEKTPSFKVDPATQLWHCFGCGAGGDVFGFAMQREHLEFPEAVRMLADRARIEIREEAGGLPRGRKERLMEASEAAADFYHHFLTHDRGPDATAARDYLARRGFGIDVARRFTLGYAPGRGALVRHLRGQGFTAEELVEANLAYPPRESGDGGAAGAAGAAGAGDGDARRAGATGAVRDRFFARVMFPIRDLNGRTIAFGGRVIGDGEPKYLNTQETPIFHKSAHLYAIEKAKGSIVAEQTALVVEGYTDVIALHEAGVTNAVATLGTALTPRHVKLLGRFAKRVVYLFDGDEAGLRAADRAVEFIDESATPESGASRVELFVAVLPPGSDPADYVAAEGAEALQALVAGAEPLIQFAIERRLAASDLSTPGGRATALAEAAAILAPIKGSILAHDYTNYLADRLHIDHVVAKAAVDKARPRPRSAQAGEQDAARGSGAAGEGAPGERSDAEGGAAGAPEVLDAAARAERALVALVAAHPHLRPGAVRLLDAQDPPLFSDPVARTLLASISAVNVTGDDLYRTVAEKSDERAAAVLVGLLMDVPEEQEVHSVACQVLAKVKELAVERLINERKARLKELEASGDRAGADELFRSVASLQAERDRLRRGVVPTEAEVWDQ